MDGEHGIGNDGYSRGKIPAVGAVACWRKAPTVKSDYPGHVAIVERILDDEAIIISESGWNSASYWGSTLINKDANGNWVYGSGYTFQGFIYCPTLAAVTKEDICVENRALSTEEMKPNAQYIWQYLGTRGWSMNAVAALLGNMQEESSMSPCRWEGNVNGSIINSTTGEHTINPEYKDSKRGYGLVQWTRYTKLYNWCQDGTKNGTGTVLPYWDIDSQLARIIWEVNNNDAQWGLAHYNKGWEYKGESFDNLTFKDFTESEKNPGWLAAAFAYCYEKSWFTDWTDSDDAYGLSVKQERLHVCTTRDKFATYWYDYLMSLPPIAGISLAVYVKDLKVVERTHNSVSIAFLSKNVESASYKQISQDETSADNTKESDDKSEDTDELDGIEITLSEEKLTKFTINDLLPNTEYSICLTFKGTNKDKLKETLNFTTLQDYPETPAKIELLTMDTRLPNDLFQLNVEPVEYWGYWKKNDYAYEIQLVVNGKTVSKLENSDIEQFTTFSLTKDFNWTPKIYDTIQLGIRTRVKDDEGRPVYDSEVVKTSNPICLLKQPIVVYLNNK